MRWMLLLLLTACSANEGAWTWFNDPRAIVVGDTLLVGSASSDGSINVATVRNGLWNRQQIGHPRKPDDHDNPAFLEMPDGRVLAFYTRHHGWDYMVAEAGPDLVFGKAVNIAPQLGRGRFTYANPVRTGQGVALFYRCGEQREWTICRSDSRNGRKWTTGKPLLASGGERPYFKLTKSGGRIDFVVTDGHPAEVNPNAVRHFYTTGGRYFDSFGNDLGPPPLDLSRLTKIADHGWLWDIKPGLIAYTTFDQYHLARWNNGWRSEPVADAGPALYPEQAFYRGGIAIGGADTLYLAQGFKLYRYTRHGAGWDATFMADGFRPFVVGGYVAYVSGDYWTYRKFDTRIKLLPR